MSFCKAPLRVSDSLAELVIDDSRNILYGRTENGSLQVFDLGSDGKSLSKIAAISHQTIVQNASLLAKYLPLPEHSVVVLKYSCGVLSMFQGR